MASVACTRPPVRRQMRKVSTVPKARWPASRQRARALHIVEQPGDLGGREVGIEQQPGLGGDRRLVAGLLQARHMSAVRRSCQTMARWMGLAVRRSQMRQVSRWLVMPTAAMSLAVEPGGGDGLPGGLHRRAPDVLGVVLHPARGRVVLGELALAEAPDGQIRPEHDGAARRGALIQREDRARLAMRFPLACVLSADRRCLGRVHARLQGLAWASRPGRRWARLADTKL